MKFWGVLFFISILTNAHARIVAVTAKEEEQTGPGISRPDSGVKENTEILILPKEEKEDPAPVFFSPGDSSSSGGGVRLLDPKYLAPKDTVPPADAPWWERLWFSVKNWAVEIFD